VTSDSSKQTEKTRFKKQEFTVVEIVVVPYGSRFKIIKWIFHKIWLFLNKIYVVSRWLLNLLQLPRMVRFPARMVESLLLLAPLLDPWVRLRLTNPSPEDSSMFVDIHVFPH
jgi:hypothetical protein